MSMVDIIEKKKLGEELTKEEIDFWITGLVTGKIPDYQTTALLMAIRLKGMTDLETFNLTESMMNSGDTLDLSDIQGVKADKHSTGGVGDKTSMALCPMVASLGLKIAKMSGRGLGFTGGTLDKLEAIPGMSVTLTPARFKQQVSDIG
ncbi:MAG: pyrimidine-nucleoside phosphorylase, partial [Bacilli bacterium]